MNKPLFDTALDLVQATALFSAAERDLTIPVKGDENDPLIQIVARYGAALADRDFSEAATFYEMVAKTQDEGTARRAVWEELARMNERLAQETPQPESWTLTDQETFAAQLSAQILIAAPGSEEETSHLQRFKTVCDSLTKETPLGGLSALIPLLDKAAQEKRDAVQDFCVDLLNDTSERLLSSKNGGPSRLDVTASCAALILPQALADAVTVYSAKGSDRRERAVLLFARSVQNLAQTQPHSALLLCNRAKKTLEAAEDWASLREVVRAQNLVNGRFVPPKRTFRPISFLKRICGQGEG